MISPATRNKRSQLADFIQRKLEPVDAVQGVVAIGSVGSGQASQTSDIDAVVFIHPFDAYVVPAEATWHAGDDTWHSIFEPAGDGIQFDFKRVDWTVWRSPAFEWPESMRSELKAGWLAFDRTGEIKTVINERTHYDDQTRTRRLDEAITWLDQHLGEDTPQKVWHRRGTVVAHDRLEAAYDWLIRAFFAYNRCWRPWRNREMEAIHRLDWKPDDFDDYILVALNAPSYDYAGYMARVDVLRRWFGVVLAQLQADSDYGDDPISEAFVRAYEEPGRAWNIAEWQEKHRQIYGDIV
jgi:hypothetical protein